MLQVIVSGGSPTLHHAMIEDEQENEDENERELPPILPIPLIISPERMLAKLPPQRRTLPSLL